MKIQKKCFLGVGPSTPKDEDYGSSHFPDYRNVTELNSHSSTLYSAEVRFSLTMTSPTATSPTDDFTYKLKRSKN
jgi:hypothetical protein